MADVEKITLYPEAMQVRELGLSRLDNATLLIFLNKAAEDLRADEYVKARLNDYFIEFIMGASAYDQAFKQEREAIETKELVELDDQRDKALTAYHTALLAALKNPLDEKKRMARQLEILYNKYKPEASQEYMKESSLINEMLDELSTNYQLEQAYTKLGLKDWVDDLKAKNKAFMDKMKQRTTAAEWTAKGVVYQARLQAEAAYRKFIRLWNVAAVYEGDDHYESAMRKLNAEIDHYKRILAQKSGKGGGGEDAQPDVDDTQSDEKSVETAGNNGESAGEAKE